MMNPFAYFDCLAITSNLNTRLGGVSVPEMHLFAYLGCLLAVFRGRPVSDWEYGFSGTQYGSPFSSEVENAASQLSFDGHWLESEGFYTVTDSGREEFRFLSSLKVNRDRAICLEAACASTLAIPIGIIRDAISRDRELQAVVRVKRTRTLLGAAAIESLHTAFNAILVAAGHKVDDLLVPAVVWVRYLASSDRES